MEQPVAKTPRPSMLTADAVAERLKIKKGSAYEVIRQMNREQEALGRVAIRGRVRSNPFDARYFPEEYELIANMAAWSGMSRQDYIMARLTGTEVTVRPSSRTQRALRDSMKGLAERLLAVCDADELDADLQRQLALVMEIFNGFGEAPPPGRRAKREKGPSDDLFGMSRY